MKKGFTLVETMVVVVAIVALAAIVIPNLLRSKINANEAVAQKLVRDMAVASETYAFANKGVYPSSSNDLINSTPKYLTENFTQGIRYGYNFTTTFTPSGYSCTASPVSCNKSGKKVFNIATKGNVALSDCVPPPECTAPLACGTYPACIACPTCADSGLCGTYPDCVACACTAPTACGTYPDCIACSCSPLCGTYPSCHTCTCDDLGLCGTWGSCYTCPCSPVYNKYGVCISCCIIEGGGE